MFSVAITSKITKNAFYNRVLTNAIAEKELQNNLTSYMVGLVFVCTSSMKERLLPSGTSEHCPHRYLWSAARRGCIC